MISAPKISVCLLCLLDSVVACGAERLVVISIPEQLVVASVWSYMVNHFGGDDLTYLLVISTERVLFEE